MPGVRLSSREGRLWLETQDGRRGRLVAPEVAWRALVRGATVAQLKAFTFASTEERVGLFVEIDALKRRGLVVEELWRGGELLARREIFPGFVVAHIDPDGEYVLSRFSLVRRDGPELLLESPRSLAMVRLLHRDALVAVGGGPPRSDLIRFLAESRLLVPEGSESHLGPWDFHDLLFHARSRLGRHRNPLKHDLVPELPPRRPPQGSPLPLPKADLGALKESDLPFTKILEERSSRRGLRAEPLTLELLGAFLYRTARHRSQEGTSPRPYPTGGYPGLELYLNVRVCDGLEPGLYRYLPEAHALEPLPADESALAAQFELSRQHPAVLITMAADFEAMNREFRSIAYAIILKNVGVLMQTMYLVATAMELAPCAIGCGDSDHFARLTGLPYEVQGSVGEFALS